MNESVNERKREPKNERRNELRYNELINVITIFGAVKRGSLIRCAISSPLSSADLQNKVTDNLLIRQQKRFFMTVYCNTASFQTFVPKRYNKIFVPEFILQGMRRKFTRTLYLEFQHIAGKHSQNNFLQSARTPNLDRS